MRASQIKISLSLAVMLAASALLYFQIYGLTPKVEARPHVALGEALAGVTMKQAAGGGRISVIAPDIAFFEYPGVEIQLRAFHRVLRQAGVSVAGTNLIRLDPLRLSRVPPGDFVEILRKRTETDVVVSFLGLSELTPENRARLPEKRPHVIAVCSGDTPRQVNLKSLFDERVLETAVISRPNPPLSPPSSDNSPVWFDAYFLLVTAGNLADLPAGSAGLQP